MKESMPENIKKFFAHHKSTDLKHMPGAIKL